MDFKPQLFSAVMLLAVTDCIPVRGVPKPKTNPAPQQKENPCQRSEQRIPDTTTAQRRIRVCVDTALPVCPANGLRS
jgi:hypothetical protein